MQFPTTCHGCYKDGVLKMCTCTIPYFKEIIIMSFLCDYCGFKSSEVKTGGPISDKGKKITLKAES